MDIFITGVAGFIGFHLARDLLNNNYEIIGIDNLNSYYDPELKKSRLKILFEIAKNQKKHFKFIECDLKDRKSLDKIFKEYKPRKVINLAAQAGVRYSLKNPSEYISSNLTGFFNIIDLSKETNVKHFLYASSSSVYGGNEKLPFSESDGVDHPVSIYAATKKSNEMIAHCYSHLFNLPTTGLRFFTVYGPWGRPDMALFLFTKAMIKGEKINIFNNGDMVRDFTYIDDVVRSVNELVFMPPLKNDNFDRLKSDPSSSWAPFEIFNIGNSNPVSLMKYIDALENELGLEAKKNFMQMQKGDVVITSANTIKLENKINFKPSTSIKDGIAEFVKWYKYYYKV